jgi:hypothetical protein
MARMTVAVAVLLAVATSSGCGACRDALLEGTLVRDGVEMAVLNAEVDVTYPVAWPAGWSARDVDGVLHLFGGAGQDIGAEGDRFTAGGGFSAGPNETFEPCGDIQVTPASD